MRLLAIVSKVGWGREGGGGGNDLMSPGMEWWHMKAYTETPNTSGIELKEKTFGEPCGTWLTIKKNR